MKIAKLVIGIISIVFSLLILFQSCAAGIGNILTANTTDKSGSGGLLVAILFLTAGITGIATRNSRGGGITTGVFYMVAGLIGYAFRGTYGDLIIWAIIAVIFGTVFIVGSLNIGRPNDDMYH